GRWRASPLLRLRRERWAHRGSRAMSRSSPPRSPADESPEHTVAVRVGLCLSGVGHGASSGRLVWPSAGFGRYEDAAYSRLGLALRFIDRGAASAAVVCWLCGVVRLPERWRGRGVHGFDAGGPIWGGAKAPRR